MIKQTILFTTAGASFWLKDRKKKIIRFFPCSRLQWIDRKCQPQPRSSVGGLVWLVGCRIDLKVCFFVETTMLSPLRTDASKYCILNCSEIHFLVRMIMESSNPAVTP